MHEAQVTEALAQLLIGIGALFAAGLVADLLGRRTPLPRVSLLLLIGFAVGPGGFDQVPASVTALFPVMTAIALTMVGFLLGARLTRRALGDIGRTVLGVSVGVVIVTCMLVTTGLAVLGLPLDVALLLGGIAMATAPAATSDVVREQRASGRFTATLLGIVAIDDAWGLLLFSLLLTTVRGLAGDAGPFLALQAGLAELALAVGLGLLLGLPLAYLSGRVDPGEPTQSEALGAVMLAAGLSLALGVSYILTAMVMGLTVASLARHHSRPFHEIEGIEWPFLVLFFFLAGASLEPDTVLAAGWAGAAFMVLRVAGRLVGARLGAAAVGAPPVYGRWLGIALLPQAGVSVGLALLANQHLPELGELILPIVIGSTVVFEIVGPLGTRLALKRAGEARER